MSTITIPEEQIVIPLRLETQREILGLYINCQFGISDGDVMWAYENKKVSLRAWAMDNESQWELSVNDGQNTHKRFLTPKEVTDIVDRKDVTLGGVEKLN
jgi:hypothetical protein